MACVPPDRFAAVIWATPLLLSATVPSTDAPSSKVTVPVGVPAVSETTCAVKVTDCPKVEGLRLELSDVEVPAWMPVPDRGAWPAPVGLLSFTTMYALATPVEVGRKSIPSEQLLP